MFSHRDPLIRKIVFANVLETSMDNKFGHVFLLL